MSILFAALALVAASSAADAEGCKNHYILTESCGLAGAGEWQRVDPLKRARDHHEAVLLQDGSVLVVGGWSGAGMIAEAERYVPVRDRWTEAGSLAQARLGATATLLNDGRVLVIGGVLPSEAFCCLSTAIAELFDPATGTWRVAAMMATPRSDHTATLLQDGRVLVTGGWDGENYRSLASAEIFDPVTSTFSATGRLVTGRGGHTATLLGDGSVLVARGTRDGDLLTTLATAELYDPSTGVWRTTGKLSKGSVGHTASVLGDGRVLVTGGNAGGAGASPPLGVTEIYDPATESWTRVADLSIKRFWHSAVTLADGRVQVAGGMATQGAYPSLRYLNYASVEEFDPVLDRWTLRESLSAPRYGHRATVLRDGRVLVTGGSTLIAYLSSTQVPFAEAYNPVPLEEH